MKEHQFIVNVSVIVANESGAVLIQKRSKSEDKNPGKWGIPGGKLDSTDKNLQKGLRREVQEEIGIGITNIRLFESHIVKTDEENKLYIVFTARLYSGEPRLSKEVDQIKWATYTSIPEDDKFTPQTRKLIISYMKHKEVNSF